MAMEFLRLVKRRSLISELIYILLNIGLAIAVLVIIWATESPWPAFALVILSKWRILAVRPRYWFAHVQANMVDLIVSLGLVVLLWSVDNTSNDQAISVQILLALLYAAWLLLLKPRTKRSYVVAQAGVALFVGPMALYIVSYEWVVSGVVLLMWLIGYSAARHVFSAYSDTSLTFMSLLWGFVIAQIGWLAYHWAFAYTVPVAQGLQLPQVSIVVVAISFLAERIYASYAKHGTVRSADVILPILLSISVIVLLLLLFNAKMIGVA